MERLRTQFQPLQPEIAPHSEANLVIGIMWRRVGSPLPPYWPPRENGSHYESAFVWEIETAIAAHRLDPYGRPPVLLFRREAGVLMPPENDGAAEVRAQVAALEEVLFRWTHEGGRFVAAYNTFRTEYEFEARLEATLRLWLDAQGLTDSRATEVADDRALLEDDGSVSFVIRQGRLGIAHAPSTDDGELRREVEAALAALLAPGGLERLHNTDPALFAQINEYKVLFEAEGPSGYALYASGARIEILLTARERMAADDPGEALPPLLVAGVSSLLLVHHAYVASFPAVMARVKAGIEARRSVLSYGETAARDARSLAAHADMIKRMADSAELFDDAARSLVKNLRDTVADKTPPSVPLGPRAVAEDVVRGFLKAVARIVVASTLIGGSAASAVALGVLGNAASEGVKNSAIFRSVSEFAQHSTGEMERLWTELPEHYSFLRRLRDVVKGSEL